MKKLLITLGSILMMMFASQSAIAQCPGDVTPPTAVCQDLTLYLDSMGNVTLTLALLDGGSFDDCPDSLGGGITLSGLTQSTFNCSNIGGTTLVGMTVTDNSGNSSFCQANITISDSIAPTAVCQDIVVNLDPFGNATITASMLDGGSTDLCGTPSFSASKTSFNCSDIGANIVTLTVTDGNGNSSTCTSTVTVLDPSLPSANCQNITIYLDSSGNTTIDSSDVDNGSSSGCNSFTLSLSNSTFTCANIGPNSVTLYITDANQNIDSCFSTVIVSDTISPTAICQNITVQLDGSGNVTIDSSDVNNGSFDNCAISTITLDQTSFTCSDIGANTVTLTVTDVNGNISTCTSTVTVQDNINPTVTCQNIIVQLDGSGNASITPSEVDNGSSDNCSFTLSLSDSSFT
ncbi:hypothetical protein N9544_04545, partial [Flavobacteriales bacterium]|nr:hypothetical protein [Flavobacteriales bacterium]